MSSVIPGSSSIAPAVLTPHPGVSNVILASTNQFRLSTHKLNKESPPVNLGLRTIELALNNAGFRSVTMFSPNPERVPDIANDAHEIVDEFKRLGAAEKGAIIGISSTTVEWFKFPALSELFREAFPDAMIVAGGSHFVRENIDGYADPVEYALYRGFADVVQTGHARAFVEFITKHNGRLDRVDGRGLYWLDPGSRKLMGRGYGKFPELNKLPHYRVPDGDDNILSVMFGSACRNGCDFCAVPRGSSINFPVDMIVEGMTKLLPELRPAWISLEDVNPLEEWNVEYYKQIFDALDAVRPTAKGIYMNPSHLPLPDYMVDIGRMIHSNYLWLFFIGRDAVTETGARAIGSRYHGKVKDQEQLDREGYALQAFMRLVQRIQKRQSVSQPRKITLSYIMTPEETHETALAIIRDMAIRVSMSGDLIDVSTPLFDLMPFPGTRVRRRMKGVIDLEDFEFGRREDGIISPWKKEAGPALEVMARLPDIYGRDEVQHLKRIKGAVDEILGNG